MVKQTYSYTDQEQVIWTTLYSRIIQFLPETADHMVLQGIKRIGFPADHIPDFEDLNKKIKTFSDWEIVPLENMVEDKEFIGMLASKKYPCRTWIRSVEQMEQEEDVYDIFHDVIGHTPLLTIPSYCEYLTGLGKLALEYLENDSAIALLKRVYWHSIQFGIKATDQNLTIYGAHLLTSGSETAYSLSAGVPKYDFNVAKMMETPYIKNRFQERYFVINNYEELFNSLDLVKKELKNRI